MEKKNKFTPGPADGITKKNDGANGVRSGGNKKVTSGVAGSGMMGGSLAQLYWDSDRNLNSNYIEDNTKEDNSEDADDTSDV